MIGSAIPVFLMMLGAAFLGFLLSWILAKSPFYNLTNEEIPRLESQNARLQGDYERVLEYSNNFHKEKKDLLSDNEMLSYQIRQLKAELTQLENDKSFLIQEYHKFEDEDLVTENGGRATDNEEEIQALRIQVNDLNQELFTWKNRHKDLSEQMSQVGTDLEAQAKNKTKSGKNKKWESKYKALKLKYLELTHKKNVFENQMESLKEANDKLLSEILELKTNLPEPQLIVEKSKKKEKEKDIFQKIKKRASLIDFKRIGKASEKKKDDLKQINGVGPFIEKKLNALGIFKFEQIAKLKDEDLMEIIKIIELPSSVVKGRNWIDQAKKMK